MNSARNVGGIRRGKLRAMNQLCASAPAYAREFKSNWSAFFERMSGWWDGTLDGPVVRIEVPAGNWRPAPPPDDTDWEARFFDTVGFLERHEDSFRHHRYLTDHAPCLDVGSGHGIGSFLGCPLEFRRETTWTHPCLRSLQDPVDVTRWRRDSRWTALRERVRYCSERGSGRYGVGYYLGGILQALSLMRGDEPFLMDLLDHPESVEALRDRLLQQWFCMAEELEALLPKAGGQWTLFWLWAPGRVVFCECDVSCNFSPALFRRMVVPEVQAMARWADYSLYHLDGPGAVKHLDALLEVPELDAIQWIRGDGAGGALDWLSMLRRIQAGGKKLYVECSASELEPLLGALDSRGLLVHVEPCATESAVDLALRAAARHGNVQGFE